MGFLPTLIQFTRLPMSFCMVKLAVIPLKRTTQPPKRFAGSFAKTLCSSFSSQSHSC